ncbi:site-specific integrase [Pseudomonas asiatica]|uniref:Tyr recombinase domain-containing protein n=1 Tax=Pseudomonas asiatica TaxID=2219225 RepID=A0A9X4D272_9PSED|nr:site-specific integrase [Pseudomonas asiatica]MDD2108317.1 hypothetical protein [Pseudomonas asiatica]
MSGNHELVNFYYDTHFYGDRKLRVLVDKKTNEVFEPHKLLVEHFVDLGLSGNTTNKYSYRAGTYFDYLQVGFSLHSDDGSLLQALSSQYHSYLTDGLESTRALARSVASIKPSPMINDKNSEGYHAPVKKFVGLAQSYVVGEIVGYNEKMSEAQKEFLCAFASIHYLRRKRSVNERKKIQDHAANRRDTDTARVLFPHVTSNTPEENEVIEEDKYFPLDRITKLIESASCFRDAALWALIAGTGVRPSEALQILECDVDYFKQEVVIVDPGKRGKWRESYPGFSRYDYNRLSFKGRTTEFTLFLEPYATLFFENIYLYKKFEYSNPHGYSTVFLTKNGQPLFLSDYGSTVLRPFKNAALKVLGDDVDQVVPAGLHSLRHSYNYFFKNFIKHPDGSGLTDDELILLSGHVDFRSMRKYGKLDRELLLEKISLGLISRRLEGEKSSSKYVVEFLQQRLDAYIDKLKN